MVRSVLLIYNDTHLDPGDSLINGRRSLVLQFRTGPYHPSPRHAFSVNHTLALSVVIILYLRIEQERIQVMSSFSNKMDMDSPGDPDESIVGHNGSRTASLLSRSSSAASFFDALDDLPGQIPLAQMHEGRGRGASTIPRLTSEPIPVGCTADVVAHVLPDAVVTQASDEIQPDAVPAIAIDDPTALNIGAAQADVGEKEVLASTDAEGFAAVNTLHPTVDAPIMPDVTSNVGEGESGRYLPEIPDISLSGAEQDAQPTAAEPVGPLSIKGLFPLLELVSEVSNGGLGSGLVDKIVVSQESLRALINEIRPGAYKSVTKINFAALDAISIRPTGIYGSKSEIVRFFRQVEVIDDKTASSLLVEGDTASSSSKTLRSGIYFLIPPTSRKQPTVFGEVTLVTYVVYWPEPTTWDDSAVGSVRTNRITFMRHLTRLADQIRALISPDHSSSIVWKDVDRLNHSTGPGNLGFDLSKATAEGSDDENDDRFFTFEVSQTVEQEENAKLTPGFSVHHPEIRCDVDVGSDSKFSSILAQGEIAQSFLSSRHNAGSVAKRNIQRHYNPVSLQSMLTKHQRIILSETLDSEVLHILLEAGGLKCRFPNILQNYHRSLAEIEGCQAEELKRTVATALNNIMTDTGRLSVLAKSSVARAICDIYPTFHFETFLKEMQRIDDSSARRQGRDGTSDSLEQPQPYLDLPEGSCPACEQVIKAANFGVVTSARYKTLKERFFVIRRYIDSSEHVLLENDKARWVESALVKSGHMPRPANPSVLSRAGSVFRSAASAAGLPIGRTEPKPVPQDADNMALMGDPVFLQSARDFAINEPIYQEGIDRIRGLAVEDLVRRATKVADAIFHCMLEGRERAAKVAAEALSASSASRNKLFAFSRFREEVCAALARQADQPALIIIGVVWDPSKPYSPYWLDAVHDMPTPPSVDHSLWTLHLRQDDVRRLREDDGFAPLPQVSSIPSLSFETPPEFSVRHIQRIGQKVVLVVVSTPQATLVWLFPARYTGLPDKATKVLPRLEEKKFIVAVDERKRLIAFIVANAVTCVVQMYLMDESYMTLSARGPPLDLGPWYQDVKPSLPDIIMASFFSGTDELCLIESSGRMRILSSSRCAFRPGSLNLSTTPSFVQSAPDGSAMLVVEEATGGERMLRIIHHASFGKHPTGIVRRLPDIFNGATSFSVTSFRNKHRDRISLMATVPSFQSIVSATIGISKKSTEYQFRSKEIGSEPSSAVRTAHNSLIDCFSDVWERFPVVAAIQRDTLSSERRLTPSILFATDSRDCHFEAYFKHLVLEFERVSRKPTEQHLESIQIVNGLLANLDWADPAPTSTFRLGEWLVEMLCLIPIHIAMASENRFVPLKDGVFDRTLEQQLLGADVSTIIDAISYGWYESIFSSYMASKSVKVVSSMGEQSVGKSYSLNHMIDSSFAGSAVRTTEGVWMSVCPTRETLIVALDFEGVHSLERTAQEDMLLVLFNTALSNLVLFRNNFALSRNVASMFTSFQASTRLFDPAANPKLFQGMLAIVIKDVVESDSKEIVNEFSSKFHDIVAKEQEYNFMTMLHAGQVTVIPWSVIQSRDFYKLFRGLSKLLGHQKVTHGSAGEFLVTMKTLMAKMKAQDWGSLDQTLIKHRAAALTALLPSAYIYGKLDDSALGEELTNIEDQSPVPHQDSDSRFCVDKDPAHILAALASHLSAWKPDAARHPLNDLRAHLSKAAEQRIRHVQDWIAVNIVRFPAENADIRQLTRLSDDMQGILVANIQLCLVECSECRLPCTLNKAHDQLAHECGTSHHCEAVCDFAAEHISRELCGLPAGHGDRHICNGTAHLCQEKCDLDGRKGCEVRCTRAVDHAENGHLCSARTHQCAQPCDVRDMPLGLDETYSCPNVCTMPYDDVHDLHSCENRQTCPIKCQLCSRYCTSGNHFHGFSPTATHLCDQEHSCRHECEADGICEINVAPQSVQEVFVGLRETFQYTKYTQVAHRQPCAITIPPGSLGHTGLHSHSIEIDVFHFCTATCGNCGYICTLPLGHPQREHETAHGSMERTQWAIEGPADTSIEVEGHTFAALDGGAPQLCSSFCRSLGRHAHIDYCRNVPAGNLCQEPELEHISEPMRPFPSRPKDWTSHRVFWARTGFRDPYSRREQQEFALCDASCAGSEHEGSNASRCTLELFHPPQPLDWPADGSADSHVSADGHAFSCPNPRSQGPAYHVIFVLDKSSSMLSTDRLPLPNQPVTPLIVRSHNNRFGAVLSALFELWTSMASRGSPRRDSFSAVAFSGRGEIVLQNDLQSSPEELIQELVSIRPGSFTDFDEALRYAQHLMETHWSAERSPVVVFLSDGECRVNERSISGICNRAVALGKPLSFHSISFGQDDSPRSLVLMRDIANAVLESTPHSISSNVTRSTFSEAEDSVRLAEAFFDIAESLQQPRASLIRIR